MNRSRTVKKRLDYKILHERGFKVEKLHNLPIDETALTMTEERTTVEETYEGASSAAHTRNVKFQFRSLMEDIDDFLEENPISGIRDFISDLDVAIKRAEELRTSYRNKFKEIEIIDEDDESLYTSRLQSLKDYILEAKEERKNCRSKEGYSREEAKHLQSEAFNFISEDIERLMFQLESECAVNVDHLEEMDLVRRNKDLIGLEGKLKILADKFPEMLTYCVSREDNTSIQKFKDRYKVLVSVINPYILQIKKQIEERELDKEEIFKASNLNIKLEKFRGYGSDVDIYTFQSEFEKIHLRSTPKRMLPEMLKNNYLGDTALSMVKSMDNIEVIWKRLKEAFGDPKIMLDRKIEEINKMNHLWKMRGTGKTIDGLQKIINLMKDLMELSKKHNIENQLYYSDALERIVRVLGDSRATRWISETCDKVLSNKESWENLVSFLEKETKVMQQKVIFLGKDLTRRDDKDVKGDTKDKRHGNYHFGSTNFNDGEVKDLTCSVCEEDDHFPTIGPNNSKVIQYFSCKKFVEMTPAERFATLRRKGLCWQCLFPGALAKFGKHADGKCQRDFVCKHPSHAKFKRKKHVLLCEEHKETEENKKILDEYKSRCIIREKHVNLPTFSKEIKLVFHSKSGDESIPTESNDKIVSPEDISKDAGEKAIYQLQIINVNGEDYSIFYDSGCGDFVSRYTAVTRIGERAWQENKGPIQIGGVGGCVAESPHGIYSVKLPLSSGQDAHFTGICLDEITCEFPRYPIRGAVEKDIHDDYRRSGGVVQNLPKLPRFVGGAIDYMIGIKYLRYHPKRIFQLPSGLTIYESMFKNSDGGRGVIGGPHEVFTAIEKQFYLQSNHQLTFLCNQEELYRNGYQINPDVSLLGINVAKDCREELFINSEDVDVQCLGYVNKEIKKFENAERCGSEITYRCVKCRSCKACKECEITEAVSIKEEVEENLISNSIEVDVDNRICIARLPFIMNPVSRLCSNKNKALKVYSQQLKKLSKDSTDKEDVLKSERKLQELNFVQYVRDLPERQKHALQSSPIQNFIPWRVVWKENSLSTPCRVVFDASQPTSSGYSLNDVLAKGRNNLNKLQEILIRWLTHKVAFHSDVQKMYNCVKLHENDWCYQRYIWQDELDPGKIPDEKVIKILIYGVRSSGNLAERCIHETAKLSKEEYPEIDDIVHKDFYVDDCLTGGESEMVAYTKADQLEVVLNRGGFSLKGVSFSQKNPPEELSDDGSSIVVAGIRWFTKDDLISLNLGDMIFSKKQRGRKPRNVLLNNIPERLTRRHCVAKVAEVYDILGKSTPVTAVMKLDLQELVVKKLNWDDVIPDSLRPLWVNNFEMIQEMKNMKFKRAVIPVDAVDLKMDTLEFGDASKSLLCVAIYIRFERQNGEHSCQLILSRSRIIPDSMSQPRAELYAAVVNAHSGEIVKRALYKHHYSSMKFTDSQIVLHWINNEEKPLKQWVRNRVMEIRRFTEKDDWRYIDSKNMIADLGTRRGSKLRDVGQDSLWINGLAWMKESAETFPVKSAREISLAQSEIQEVKRESPYEHERDVIYFNQEAPGKVPSNVLDRYVFSNYLIDPNRRDFKMIIRITAIVFRFIKILRESMMRKVISHAPDDLSRKQLILSEEEIQNAENYFFKKATEEVKQFR